MGSSRSRRMCPGFDEKNQRLPRSPDGSLAIDRHCAAVSRVINSHKKGLSTGLDGPLKVHLIHTLRR